MPVSVAVSKIRSFLISPFRWLYGKYLCYYEGFIAYFVGMTGLYLLTALSLNRYGFDRIRSADFLSFSLQVLDDCHAGADEIRDLPNGVHLRFSFHPRRIILGGGTFVRMVMPIRFDGAE